MVQMGVERILLDSAYVAAHKVWTSSSMGFACITEMQFWELERRYTLVFNSGVVSRLMKHVPSRDQIMIKVKCVALCT